MAEVPGRIGRAAATLGVLMSSSEAKCHDRRGATAERAPPGHQDMLEATGPKVSAEAVGRYDRRSVAEIRRRSGWRHGHIPKTPSASAWRWG
jgi:hypothetical protein